VSNGWTTEYYELPDGAKEMQDLIEHRDMNFAMGNVFKACYRYGHKENTSQEYDLNKIIWYATRELERVQKCRPENPPTPIIKSTTPRRKRKSSVRLVTKPGKTQD
jgi:hypothetical protein